MMRTTKYTPSAHVRENPEIATKESVVLLERIWREKLKNVRVLKNIEEVTAIARTLRIPTKGPKSWMRKDFYTLCSFLDGLRNSIERYLAIQEKKIASGSKVFFMRSPKPRLVEKVDSNLFIRIEGVQGAQNPIDCEPV